MSHQKRSQRPPRLQCQQQYPLPPSLPSTAAVPLLPLAISVSSSAAVPSSQPLSLATSCSAVATAIAAGVSTHRSGWEPTPSLHHHHPHHHHHSLSHSHSHSHPQHVAHGHHQQQPSSSLPSANPFSPTHHARGATEIIPRLYISDLSFAENPACLASHRITHILSALPEAIYIPPATLLFPHPPPTRLQVRVEDFPFAELAAHLPQTTSWIGDALARDPNARVLVHCVEGISRSVSVVAAYLMAQFGWTPSEAVRFIKNKRRVAEPNFGFVQQLHEYARDSLGRK